MTSKKDDVQESGPANTDPLQPLYDLDGQISSTGDPTGELRTARTELADKLRAEGHAC